jgi:hypothetical protein
MYFWQLPSISVANGYLPTQVFYHKTSVSSGSVAEVIAPIEVAPTPILKRSVPISLLHHRIGHQSYEAIKHADAGNVWSDVKVINDPKPICQTCHVTQTYMSNVSCN